MHSFVPVSLVATVTLFSAVQGIEILKPATGDTVDATQGFDVVWTYDSSDFTNWEIELANPTPGKLVATDVTQASISGSATSTFSYHVAAFTGVADGTNYHVVLDPRNGGTGAFPESGEFAIVNGGAGSTTTTGSTTSTSGSTTSTGSTTSVSVTSTGTSTSSTPLSQTTTTSTGSSTVVITSSSSPITASSSPASTSTGSTTSVTGIPTSATVVPPISVSTGGSNSTITTSSTSFSTFISGSVTSLIPQSTIVKTTVVPGGSATSTGTGKATSSPTIALAAGGSAVSSVGLLGSIVGAILGVFML
ncbi:Hypothetical protein PENO1_063170 [Penicillium occitanis (nom. inval.)]|nr:Hypothetical protein PENO1_063170 [Penicillium occitanis (nom. inval.)]PCG97792.1 hypothetical protein PENOC_066320 [Penicillium occitanis (nom. inval.)]